MSYLTVPMPERARQFVAGRPADRWASAGFVALKTFLPTWMAQQQLDALLEEGAVEAETDGGTILYRRKRLCEATP